MTNGIPLIYNPANVITNTNTTSDQHETNQALKKNFDDLNQHALGIRELEDRLQDFSEIKLSEISTNYQIIATDNNKLFEVDLTSSSITLTMPDTTLINVGFNFSVIDIKRLATESKYITLNGNTKNINGNSNDYIKNYSIQTYYWNGEEWITSNNLLNSSNTWTGTNTFDNLNAGITDLNALTIGARSLSTTGIEIGSSLGAGTLSFLDFNHGVTVSQDYNVRFFNNANESFLLASNTKTWCSFDNSNFVLALNILPSANNTFTLGDSTHKFTEVWATNGTIQTSDAEKKENIRELNLGLDFIMKLKPVSWKWKNEQAYKKKETIYKKVYDKNNNFIDLQEEEIEIEVPEKTFKRQHQGLLSSDVKNTLDELKISTNEFAGYIKDTESGEGALRYTYFIGPIIKAIQEQQKIIADLKNEIKKFKK